MRRFSALSDAVIVVFVLVVSAWTGYRVLSERQLNTLVDELAPAVMAACGQGIVDPVVQTPQLVEFRRRARTDVSCAAAVGDGRMQTAASEVVSTRYAIDVLAVAMRIGGISWRTIDGFIAVLFGLSLSLAYLLFRLAAGRVLAVIGVVMLLFSPHTLAVALPYRDFGKELWFFAGWLGIGALLKLADSRTPWALYITAVVTGAVIGLGLGFRVDVVILIPAVIAVIAFGVPGFTKAALKIKAIAAAAFALTFAIVAIPILSVFAGESSVSHVIVLGLMTPFTNQLGLQAPPYDLGHLYSDDFAIETVYAHALLADGEQTFGQYRTRKYDEQGVSFLKDVARTFPADFAARGLGAVRQALVNPFDPQTEQETTGNAVLVRTAIGRLVAGARIAAARLIHGDELFFAAAAFLAVAVRNRRVAVIAALLVLYFPGYSMLQFARRHTFHLDVVAIGIVLVAVGGVASLAVETWRRWNSGSLPAASMAFARRAAAGLLAGVLVTLAIYAPLRVLRYWQQRHIRQLFESTLSAPAVDLALEKIPLTRPAGEPRSTWERIAKFRYIAWANPVQLQPKADAWPAAHTARLQAEYLIVDISGGPDCSTDIFPVLIKYTIVPGKLFEELTRDYYVPLRESLTIFVPVVEIPGFTHFDGIVVPAERAACVRRVRRIDPSRGAPLPNAYALLQPDWRQRDLFQILNDTPAAPGELAIMVAGQY